MAARVQIVVEAKNAAGGVLRAVTGQLGDMGNLVEELTSKNVNWGNVAQTATTMVINGIKDAIKVTQDYAKEVRDLSLASGATAEESSRLIQVLDDFEISAEDVTAATKAMTKNGLAPTIETIAQLADQYVAINDPMERNEFILKNLGKAGLQWANALSQGGDSLRALGADVDSSLILTQDSINAAEEYRLAIDEWNDAVMGLKVTIGSQLLPVLTSLISSKKQLENATVALNEAEKTGGVIMANSYEAAQKLREAHEAQNNLLPSATVSYQKWAEVVSKSAAETDVAQADMAAFNEQLGVLREILDGEVGKAQDDFNAKMDEYNNQLALAKSQKEKDEINANIAAETAAYNERATAIAFNIQQEAILNSALPSSTKIEMITALGQSYGMYDEATANAITSTNEWINRVEQGTLSEEAAIQNMKNMAYQFKATGAQAQGMVEPITHVGAATARADKVFSEFEGTQEGLAQGLNSEAIPAVNEVRSSLQKMPSSGTSWQYNFTITTSGSVPSLPDSSFSGNGQGAPVCFLAGTLITMADGNYKRIEQIAEQDKVMSYDIEHGTFVIGIVARTFQHKAVSFLNINGIRVTPEHPFRVASEWVKAGDLKRGDILFTDEGDSRMVESVIRYAAEVDVYNFEVDTAHNYFAGGVLVHNKDSETGGHQAGGQVYANRPTIVGEGGAEPFFPSVNGRILSHAEALHALSLGGGGGSSYGPFYGNVTLQIDEGGAADIMSMR